jgi:hypothetical protein
MTIFVLRFIGPSKGVVENQKTLSKDIGPWSNFKKLGSEGNQRELREIQRLRPVMQASVAGLFVYKRKGQATMNRPALTATTQGCCLGETAAAIFSTASATACSLFASRSFDVELVPSAVTLNRCCYNQIGVSGVKAVMSSF